MKNRGTVFMAKSQQEDSAVQTLLIIAGAVVGVILMTLMVKDMLRVPEGSTPLFHGILGLVVGLAIGCLSVGVLYASEVEIENIWREALEGQRPASMLIATFGVVFYTSLGFIAGSIRLIRNR